MGVVTSLQTEYTEAKLHHFWFQYLVAHSTAQIFTDGSAIGFTVFLCLCVTFGNGSIYWQQKLTCILVTLLNGQLADSEV